MPRPKLSCRITGRMINAFRQVKQQFKHSPRCVITLLETHLRTSRVQFVEVKKLVGGRLLEDQYCNNIARLLQANYSLNKLHNVRSIHEWTCEELIVHQVSITHTLDLVLNLILCLKARILPHDEIVLSNNLSKSTSFRPANCWLHLLTQVEKSWLPCRHCWPHFQNRSE